jgi:hypothetical protein
MSNQPLAEMISNERIIFTYKVQGPNALIPGWWISSLTWFTTSLHPRVKSLVFV